MTNRNLETMSIWKKASIQILLVIIIFVLITELILGSMIGYGTTGRGKFNSGLTLEGEIVYKVDNLDITGEEWEAYSAIILIVDCRS